MFRDDAQAHAAIRLLFGTIPGLARMWTQSLEAIDVWIAAQRARTRDSKPRSIEGRAKH